MCQDWETTGYTLPTDHVPGHLSFLCWNHLFASFGQWPGIWQIQAPGPARPFTCFVILADVPHQLRKPFSPCPVPPLSFGDSQLATGRNGFGKLQNALQIIPTHTFWAPTMCWGFRSWIHRYIRNPGWATGHMAQDCSPWQASSQRRNNSCLALGLYGVVVRFARVWLSGVKSWYHPQELCCFGQGISFLWASIHSSVEQKIEY